MNDYDSSTILSDCSTPILFKQNDNQNMTNRVHNKSSDIEKILTGTKNFQIVTTGILQVLQRKK